MRKYTIKPLARKNDKWYETQTKVFQDGGFVDVEELKGYRHGTIEPPILLPKIEVGTYATWFDDPSTNLMMHYMLEDISGSCLYRRVGDSNWKSVELYADKPFPFTDRRVAWFKLEDLVPDTIYETRLENSGGIYKFKTMPPNHIRDINFVMTSDMMNDRPSFRDSARQGFDLIYSLNPDALILNGDIVHDDATRIGAWLDFWDAIFASIERANGWLIPMATTIGNHDGAIRDHEVHINGLWESQGATKDNVVFFYNFFSSLGDIGYNVLDISNYLSLILLDSGHTTSIVGQQTSWLNNTLSARTGRHLLPLFHVNAYPIKYNQLGQYGTSKDIRDNWGSLFSEYGVKVAGSGHDHVSLVTKKITGDELDENGVVYVGNGHGLGTLMTTSVVNQDTWFVDYLSIDDSSDEFIRGFDLLTFKQNGDVGIKKISLSGGTMYSKSL